MDTEETLPWTNVLLVDHRTDMQVVPAAGGPAVDLMEPADKEPADWEKKHQAQIAEAAH